MSIESMKWFRAAVCREIQQSATVYVAVGKDESQIAASVRAEDIANGVCEPASGEHISEWSNDGEISGSAETVECSEVDPSECLPFAREGEGIVRSKTAWARFDIAPEDVSRLATGMFRVAVVPIDREDSK